MLDPIPGGHLGLIHRVGGVVLSAVAKPNCVPALAVTTRANTRHRGAWEGSGREINSHAWLKY